MKIILTDGQGTFGEGATKEDAILDAIENAVYLTDLYDDDVDGSGWEKCTREWIAEQLEINRRNSSHGLWFEDHEDDESSED